jgi:hypothetical protein
MQRALDHLQPLGEHRMRPGFGEQHPAAPRVGRGERQNGADARSRASAALLARCFGGVDDGFGEFTRHVVVDGGQ